MNNKVRSIIRITAITVVLLCVVMQVHWVIVPAVTPGYRFWAVAVAFGMLLVTSK